MTAFDLVALDMAGTVIDEGGLVYQCVADAVVAAVGRELPDGLLARWKGTSKDGAIRGLLTDLGEDASDARVEEVFADFNRRVSAAYRETPPRPIPGVVELFTSLRAAGVKVALQTGYGADIADSILEALSWTIGVEVDTLITSDTVAASRPAPYLIHHAMEACGVTDVRRVLAAGDTPADLDAGMNAGCGFVVGVTTGSFGREELEAQPHTHVLDSITEITALL